MNVLAANITSYSNAVNSWVAVGCTVSDVTDLVPFPDGVHKVFKVLTNSAASYIYRDISSAELNGLSVQSKQLSLGCWMWRTSAAATTSGYILKITQAGSNVLAHVFSLGTGYVPKLYNATSSICNNNSAFTIRIEQPDIIGEFYYVAMPHVGLADGYLDVNPEWDIALDSEKIENRHRAKSGKQYVYKWGRFDSVKFSLTYVNSQARNIINNSYWNNNARVLFGMEDGSIIVEGMVGGSKPPINSYQKPYLNLWKGKIDLEGGF